jgi:5-methylcytosine-specific restriction endonuclease McrA
VRLSRGGKSGKGNLVPACKECNTRKKTMLPLEWQEYLDRLNRGQRTEDRGQTSRFSCTQSGFNAGE